MLPNKCWGDIESLVPGTPQPPPPASLRSQAPTEKMVPPDRQDDPVKHEIRRPQPQKPWHEIRRPRLEMVPPDGQADLATHETRSPWLDMVPPDVRDDLATHVIRRPTPRHPAMSLLGFMGVVTRPETQEDIHGHKCARPFGAKLASGRVGSAHWLGAFSTSCEAALCYAMHRKDKRDKAEEVERARQEEKRAKAEAERSVKEEEERIEEARREAERRAGAERQAHESLTFFAEAAIACDSVHKLLSHSASEEAAADDAEL